MSRIKKLLIPIIALFIAFSFFCGWVIFKQNMHIWLPNYLGGRIYNNFLLSKQAEYPKHVIFLFVDHFEPYVATDSDEVAKRRMGAWTVNYPKVASGHRDADGRYPQHTWFYPQEMLREDLYFLKKLVKLEKQEFGEIEMHLHHSDDTSESFREKIKDFKRVCGRAEGTGERRDFAFIAGNWALDNSRLENGKNYSGVNNELEILRQENCYADFTFPSLGHTSQPAKVNSIYYAKDDPQRPKSYNWGVNVEVGKKASGDLLIVEGPLAIIWYYFFQKFRPSLDDGNLCDTYPPFKQRVDTWIKCNVHITGRPEWIFVKIFTHGCEDKAIPVVLGTPIDEMFTYLEEKYNDGKKYALHYVTARECYNIIKAAEAGMRGNPNEYRDFIIKPYIRRESTR